MSEKHIIKISVQLRQVKLLVRFPCKLTFQLKTDTSHAETRNAYELKKGECLVNQTVQTEAEVLYDPLTGQYEDKKVRLIIQMSSTNGVIPAGSVTFSPCNKEYLERVEYTLPLEKCPDRSAQITFFQSYQLLRKNTPEVVYQSQFADRTGSRVVGKYSASNVLLPSQLQKQASRDISSNSRNARLTPSNTRTLSPKQRVKTTVSQNPYLPYRQPIQQQQQHYQFGESQVLQEEQQQGYQKYSSKYVQPSEKAQYIKQIARLKGDLKSLQSEDRWDQLIRSKQENQALTSELQKARQRVRGLERRERQINLQLKEAKEEADRNKNKYLQSETAKNECQIVLAQRERVAKETTTEGKRLQQKIQDLTAQLGNQQKRIEFKQNSYQEQLRKINQKYTQSQNERQKLTFDYNSLLAKLEDTQKRNQATAKDKERAYTEEKNRLNKKLDQLTQSLDKLKEDFSEKEASLTQANNLLKASQKRENEREEKLNALESQFQLTKMLLKKQLDQRKLHEKEIEQYKAIEQERNILRKKYNELTTEMSKLSQKLERTNSDLVNSDGKVKELEFTLLERTKEKDNITNKHNSLKKQLQNLKRQEQKRAREQETLSVQNFNAGQKINDLKSKLETEKRDADQMKLYYEEQLAYLAKSKEYCDNEIEELKWSVEKVREQSEETNNRLKQSNQQILQLNEELLISAEKLKRAEQESKDLHNTTTILRKQITELEQKQRSLNDQLKTKGDSIYDLQKKLQNSDSELFIVRQKLRQTEAAYEQRRNSDEKSLKEREKALGQKGEQLTQIQLEMMTLKQELASATQEIAIKGNEINYLKDSLQTSKQDIANRDIKTEEIREQLKLSTQAVENLTKEHQTLSRINEEEKKNAAKLKKDWEDYRKDTTKALERLIEEIGKDDEGGSAKQTLLSFPDSTISVMQVEAVKKRNLILIKYQTKNLQLQEEKAVLENEVKKFKKIASEKEEELEKQVKSERQKSKQNSSDHARQREELQSKIENLEERRLQLTGDLQKAYNDIKKREELIQELTEELKLSLGERESLKSDLKASQEVVLALKSSEIKWKMSNQSKISEISGQNESVIQRYKINVADLEKRLAAEERSGKEKDENLKKLESRLNEVIYEKDRSEAKVQELLQKTAVSNEERKELEKRIKSLEKDLKESNLQLQGNKQSLTNEKVKFQEIQSKLNETYAALSQAQVLNEKLRSELESSKATATQLQQSLRERGEKMKIQGQKSAAQIKQLKEKIISLNSTIELKDFQIGQHESQIASLKEGFNEAKDQLHKKKQESIKLGDRLQEYKNQDLYTSQNIQILKSEKEFLEEQNDRLKERVAGLQEQLAECHLQIETSELREREFTKTRQELDTLRLQKDKLSVELRNSVSNTRMSGIVSSRIGGIGSGEEKKRIKELQQLLESKHIDLSLQRKKMQNEFDREKRNLLIENAELREQVANLQNQFDFQRSQLNKEIESLSEDCERLNAKLLEKDDLLAGQEKLLDALKNESNAQQIQEYIANMKAIFDRMEISKNHDHLVEYHQQQEYHTEEQAEVAQ